MSYLKDLNTYKQFLIEDGLIPSNSLLALIGELDGTIPIAPENGIAETIVLQDTGRNQYYFTCPSSDAVSFTSDLTVYPEIRFKSYDTTALSKPVLLFSTLISTTPESSDTCHFNKVSYTEYGGGAYTSQEFNSSMLYAVGLDYVPDPRNEDNSIKDTLAIRAINPNNAYQGMIIEGTNLSVKQNLVTKIKTYTTYIDGDNVEQTTNITEYPYTDFKYRSFTTSTTLGTNVTATIEIELDEPTIKNALLRGYALAGRGSKTIKMYTPEMEEIRSKASTSGGIEMGTTTNCKYIKITANTPLRNSSNIVLSYQQLVVTYQGSKYK